MCYPIGPLNSSAWSFKSFQRLCLCFKMGTMVSACSFCIECFPHQPKVALIIVCICHIFLGKPKVDINKKLLITMFMFEATSRHSKDVSFPVPTLGTTFAELFGIHPHFEYRWFLTSHITIFFGRMKSEEGIPWRTEGQKT